MRNEQPLSKKDQSQCKEQSSAAGHDEHRYLPPIFDPQSKDAQADPECVNGHDERDTGKA